MKELSIEEKAKAYDGNYKTYTELINRLEGVKGAIKKQNYGIAMDILYKPYPEYQITTSTELKESEDEKIRKAIIDVLKAVYGCADIPFISQKQTLDSYVAWLEKQGGHAKFINGIQVGDKVTRNEDGVLVNLSQLNRVAKKQGEQKQDVNIQINPSEYINDMGGNGCYLKNTTQKPADKVEPKFKIGDWIIGQATNNEPRQISEIIDQCYKSTYGGQYGFSFEDEMHLWTTQDAKDGDVLCDYSEAYDNPLIFILKKFEHVNFGLVRPSDYSSYCFLTAGDIQRFKEGTYHHKHNIKPATKEQRDTLMKAMADAGYTFDFENKELKKIEQKPKKCMYYNDNYKDEDRKVLCDGCEEDCKLKQKPAWSEEDDEHLERILKELENQRQKPLNSPYLDKIESDYNWLKFIKDKVQPQNTWKPSDEQMNILWDVIGNLKLDNYKHVGVILNLYQDLKKLMEE